MLNFDAAEENDAFHLSRLLGKVPSVLGHFLALTLEINIFLALKKCNILPSAIVVMIYRMDLLFFILVVLLRF